MARKGHGRPANLVQISGSGTTYPDDGSSPVGSNEWNANRDTTGILGVTKKTEAIASANTINVTDSYIEITTADSASGGSSDGIRTLAAVTTALSTDYYPSDTSTKSYVEGDLIYVVKAAGQATTSLVHQGGGAGAGKITTLTGEDKELSATVPTILLARTIGANVEWVEYGGGAVADSSITFAKIQDIASMKLIGRTAGSSGVSSEIALLDEDNMATDSATSLATQQSIKAYVDTQIATEDTIVELNDTTITGTPADNEVLAYDTTASKWINQTAAEAGVASSGAKLSDFAATTSAELAGIISDETGSGTLVFATSPTLVTPALGTPSALVGTNISGTASNLTAGTVTTNANLTGEVTSSGNTSTIADDIIQEANLQVSNAPTNGQVLTARSGVTGGYTWEAAAGGFVGTADAHLDMTGAYAIRNADLVFLEHKSSTYISGGSAASADIADQSQLFVEQIDSNNDALYVRLRVNGATQNVQIA